VPLPYYSRSATEAFWSEHWGGQSVEELLRIARTSPLTRLIEAHLPPSGLLLEAGCGLGQYVLLFREWGRPAVGADWSLEAVKEGARAGAPLAVMDLRTLAVRSGSVAAYLSLGVVEHDPAGPDGIVAEAARVIPPGGLLLLSVPYWNGVRRLLAPILRRRGRREHEDGGQFYQFVFTRREVRAFLEPHGFTVRSFHPYDPGRLLRKALRATLRRDRDAEGRGAGSAGRGDDAGPSALKRFGRRCLYTPPALRLLAHMILAVAVRR
jgi:SAM-dependent methyltransferase